LAQAVSSYDRATQCRSAHARAEEPMGGRIRFSARAVFLLFVSAQIAAAAVVTKHNAPADHFLHVRASTDAVVGSGVGGNASSTQWVKAPQASVTAAIAKAKTFSSSGPISQWLRAAALWATGGIAEDTLFFDPRGNARSASDVSYNAELVNIIAEGAGISVTTAILIVSGFAFGMWYLGRIIGKAVEAGIESFDTMIIGTDVHIGQLELNPFTGRMEVDDLVVDNPPNHGYASEYLLKSTKILIDIDMGKLILTLGREVHLEAIEFVGLEVIFEKSLHSSNVHDILDFMKKQRAARQTVKRTPSPLGNKAESSPAHPVLEETTKSVAWVEAGVQATTRTGWVVHRVIMEDVSLMITMTGGHGHGAHLAIGDVKYDDFRATRQARQEAGESGFDDIIRLILRTLLKTVGANLPGGETLRRAAETCCCCHPVIAPPKPQPHYKSLGVFRTMMQKVHRPGHPGSTTGAA